MSLLERASAISRCTPLLKRLASHAEARLPEFTAHFHPGLKPGAKRSLLKQANPGHIAYVNVIRACPQFPTSFRTGQRAAYHDFRCRHRKRQQKRLPIAMPLNPKPKKQRIMDECAVGTPRRSAGGLVKTRYTA